MASATSSAGGAGAGAAGSGAPSLKVLFVGPSKSRKSALVTWLAGVADTLGTEPGPTVGCRILETERNGVQLELWDVSGDQSYEAGWPAVQDAADAVIFIYNAELPGATKEVELWAEWFASKTGMPAERCICWKLAGSSGGAAGGESAV